MQTILGLYLEKMNASNNLEFTRRQAFAQAGREGVFEAQALSARAFAALARTRARCALIGVVAALGVVGNLVPAFAVSGGTAATGGDCSTSATTLLTFISDIAEAMVVIGGSVFVLIVIIGALFILFGTTPRHMHKGTDIIKNAVIGFAILIFGAGIKYIIVDLVFKRPPSSFKSTCL